MVVLMFYSACSAAFKDSFLQQLNAFYNLFFFMWISSSSISFSSDSSDYFLEFSYLSRADTS